MRIRLALGAVLVALAAACSGSGTQRDQSPPPETPLKSTSPSHGAGAPVGYVGPSVAFDVPGGWHEFYLDVSIDFFAAYGPVDGGDADYVAVSPIPQGVARRSPEKILQALAPQSSDAAPAEASEATGMTTYTASWTSGDLTQRATIVEGPRDLYLVTCQYASAMATRVTSGCASILASLHEVAPSPVTDPSGCTDRELSLIASVPLLEEAEPEPVVRDLGKACDLQVELQSGFEGDVIATLSAELSDAGWTPHRAKMVRISGVHHVWRMLADRDFDRFVVEAFVRDGVTDRYFITVFDG